MHARTYSGRTFKYLQETYSKTVGDSGYDDDDANDVQCDGDDHSHTSQV